MINIMIIIIVIIIKGQRAIMKINDNSNENS